jgi:transposase-like protein
MKKSKFTEQQIAFALQQAEGGTPVEEICRKLGISQATFFRWKKIYGGHRSRRGDQAPLRKRISEIALTPRLAPGRRFMPYLQAFQVIEAAHPHA